MPTVQPLSALDSISLVSHAQLLPPKPYHLPVSVIVGGDSSMVRDNITDILRTLMPEAKIRRALHIPSVPDAIFFSAHALTREENIVLEQFRCRGAVLVAITDSAETLASALRDLLRDTSPTLVLSSPLSTETCADAIERLRNQLAYRWLLRGMEELVQNTAPHVPSPKETPLLLTFPTVRGEETWDARTIISFESEGDESILYADAPVSASRDSILFMRLGAIEGYLEANTSKGDFVRVHKSAVVHLRHVHSAVPTGGGISGKDLTLHLTGGRTCPCSRTYKTAFLQAMGDFAEKEGGSWKKQGGLWKRG